MKNVNILAIAAAVSVIAIVVVLVVAFVKPNERKNETALLQCSTKAVIKEYAQQHGMEYSESSEGEGIVKNVPIFGAEATMRFTFADDAVSRTEVEFVLFKDSFEGMSAAELENYDIEQYKFSEENKKRISEAFDGVKDGFGQYIGCEIEHYVLIPTQEGVPTEDNDDLFYQGLLVKEYSVRDRSNVLWLLWLDASYGTSTATLKKIVDETNYEGFTPSLDLTKVQE